MTSICSNIARRALIVVDMSVEQVASLDYRAKETIMNIKRLTKSEKFAHLVDSRLWIENPSQTTLSRLYPNVGNANTPGAALLEELKMDKLEFIVKLNYSSFFDTSLLNYLRQRQITKVFICGINTDYCVFATALDAFYYGFRVYIVSDACTSVRGASGHKEGLARAQRHFDEDCLITTSQCLDLI